MAQKDIEIKKRFFFFFIELDSINITRQKYVVNVPSLFYQGFNAFDQMDDWICYIHLFRRMYLFIIAIARYHTVHRLGIILPAVLSVHYRFFP